MLLAAYVVGADGSLEQTERVVDFIRGFGYEKISLKPDDEGAINCLRGGVCAQRLKPIMQIGSIPYRPRIRGIAGDGVQDLLNQFRKLKIGFESRVQGAIPVNSPIMEWMVERSAATINRHMMGHDGSVPYERVRNKKQFLIKIGCIEHMVAKVLSLE